MRIFKVFFILNVIALLVSTLLLVQAQGTTPTGSNPDTPPYAVSGPYSIGRSWFLLTEGTEKPLILVAWYPAITSEGDQNIATLTVPDEYKLPNVDLLESIGNRGTAILNAAPDSSNAPYPLVIFSPGYGYSLTDYSNFEEHLASYGFIVIGALGRDGAFWSGLITRPVATPLEIDFAENLNRQDGSLKGLIDTKHIGVVGYSLGGYTALAAGGAQFNLVWFENWCAEHEDSPDAQDACPDLLGHKNEMLALARLDSTPTALWSSWGDPRVTAIVSQAAPAFVFGPSGLASVTIPVMVQVGSNDVVVTPKWGSYLTYDNVSSTQKALVVIEGAGHGVFADRRDGGMNNDLINHFTTAFLLDVLKGDPQAHKALLPDAISFAGIEYKTTMK